MSDQAIMNALAKRADLEAKIAKADETIKRSRSQIVEINRFIKQWEKFSGRIADAVSASNSPERREDLKPEDLSPKAEAQRQNPKKEDVAEAVIHILKGKGRAVSRDDLFDMLKKAGVNLHGKNPQMVLSTMLWRTRDAYDIVRLKSGGYALRGMAEAEGEEDTTEFDDVDE